MLRRKRNKSTAPQSSEPTTSPITLLSDTGFTQHQTSTSLQRWRTLLSLPQTSEYFISVDHHQIWRRHLAWSHRDPDVLKSAVTSRFASNMVFMSLLLGAEISVLFSPSKPADAFRLALEETHYHTANFWGGLFLAISIPMTLSTLLANFTAWAIISAVSEENSHAVLRSSIGLYAAQLPARMVVLSIYCFAIWVILFLFEILDYAWGVFVAVLTFVLIMHIVVVYSAFGRLVMYTKAMGKKQIFQGEEEDSMTANRLFEELLERAVEEKGENTPLPLYYRRSSEIREQVLKLIPADGYAHGRVDDSVSGSLAQVLRRPSVTQEITSNSTMLETIHSVPEVNNGHIDDIANKLGRSTRLGHIILDESLRGSSEEDNENESQTPKKKERNTLRRTGSSERLPEIDLQSSVNQSSLYF